MAYQPGQAAGPTVVGHVVLEEQPAGRVVQGTPYRVNPSMASRENMPWLSGYGNKRVDTKLQEVQKGAQLAQQHPKFPDSRKCQDVVWIGAFLAVLVAAVGTCYYYVDSDIFKRAANSPDTDEDTPTVTEVVVMGAIGGIASMVTAFLYLSLAKSNASCVVWTSLIFGPCFAIIVGLALIIFGLNHGAVMMIIGLVFVGIGCLSLFCVFFCYKHLIPFMIVLVRVVATVIKANLGMLVVSLVGSALGIAWSLMVGLAFFGVYMEHHQLYKDAHQGAQYAMYFVCVLIFVWGGLTAYNWCHVTYCGVFGRWYFKKDDGNQLRQSLTVSSTTSLGSICLGSFLIAVIRALEAMVRRMKQDQQEGGNIVACVLFAILECLISCIGDIMEYFTEWSYVQVAVRGVNFCTAVRITYSMCSCANITYIIQDLLLDSVVNLGALLCGGTGAAAGGIIGYGQGSTVKAIIGVIIGLISGCLAGGSAVGIISSGVKTMLALWAEDPGDLEREHPEIHREFHEKIMRNF